MNSSFEQQAGLASRNIIGRTIRDLYPEGEADGVIRLYDEILSGSADAKQEIYFEPTQKWYEISVFRTHDDEFTVAVQSITERKRADEALQSALIEAENGKRTLEAVMEHIPVGVTIADANLRLLQVSRHGLEIMGWPVDRHVGLSVEDILNEWEVYMADGVTKARVEELPLPRAIVNGDTVFGEEIVQRHADGRTIPLVCDAGPIRDSEGRITGGIVAWQDITKRKQAEAALRTAEQRLAKTAHELTESIPVGTYTMVQPPEGGMAEFDFMSRRFLEITGLVEAREEAAADPLKAFARVHPDEYDNWVALNAKAFEEKTPFYGETRLIVHGEIRWVSAESIPRVLPDGSTVWEGVVTDITERKRIEKALRESEAKYSSLFNQAVDAIYLHDFDGNMIEVNAAACEQTGYSRSELLQLSVFDIHVPDDNTFGSSKTETQRVWRQSDVGERRSLEANHKRKDGTIFPVRLTTGAIRYGNGIAIMAIVGDITERRQAEEEIERQLVEKETLLKEVHHRIKNNMAHVEGLLTIQARSHEDANVKAALMESASRVQSMRALYEKLLIGTDYTRVSIKDYLESLIDSLEAIFNERSHVNVEKRIVDFALSQKKAVPVGIIVNELLTNVFKYAFTGRDGGLVSISFDTDETRATLTVADDGVGIENDVNAGTSQGFGLSLVTMLAEQHGGTFSIESNNGTRCVVDFEI